MIDFSFYLILTCCDILLVQHVIFKVLLNAQKVSLFKLNSLSDSLLDLNKLRRN